MQTIVGRLVADAKVTQLEDGRSVVNFNLAVNDRFKPKGAAEFKEITTFYNCSYWMGTGVAEHLKRGTLVESCGRIGVNAWNNLQGEAKAGLTLHVNFIKLYGKAKSGHVNGDNEMPDNTETANANTKDDLPF